MSFKASTFCLILLLAGCATSNVPLRFLSGEGPAYPESARAAGIEGHVIVGYDVTVDGTVENVRVIESDPPGVFDDAALAAVRAWRFAAPIIGGEPRSAPARTSRVEFKLGTGDEYER